MTERPEMKITYHPRGGWHSEIHKPGSPFTNDDPLTRWWTVGKRILRKINKKKRDQ